MPSFIAQLALAAAAEALMNGFGAVEATRRSEVDRHLRRFQEEVGEHATVSVDGDYTKITITPSKVDAPRKVRDTKPTPKARKRERRSPRHTQRRRR